MSADYHKYIFDFEKRRVLGDFEGAYKNCPGIWPSQHEIDTVKHRLVCTHLERMEPGITLLDVGCGYGDFVAYLSQKGIDARGCDISPTAIQKGLKKHPGIKLETGDMAEGLAYGDNAFDIVLCFGVLQYHFDKLDRSLKEICRVARPGGILAISASIPDNPIGKEYVNDYGEFFEIVKKHINVST
ncbi:MAG: methyltransferase domain-containing protein, partial [bacterium]|nr:methyltransferase domain-containing protein [bacterium]